MIYLGYLGRIQNLLILKYVLNINKMKKDHNEQKEVWNKIAESWHHLRKKPLLSFINYLAAKWKPGKILDVGCGNCRNTIIFAKHEFDCYGIDFSDEMIKYAKKFAAENKVKINLRVATATNLPFKDKNFDYVICASMLHNIPGNESRQKAILEIKRVLKDNGEALISVWNKLQPKFIFGSKERYIGWRKGNITYYRYNYLFIYWELRRMIKKAGFKILDHSGHFGRNISFIVKKS
jgi:ubiquinone/menaquinone biosynthesis C-methylase UbiE